MKHTGYDGNFILANMELLARDGWCVVLKRLPPNLGWIIPDDPSEYGAPSVATEIGKGKWCCEAQYIRHDGYRPSQFAMHDKPASAVKSVVKACQKATKAV